MKIYLVSCVGEKQAGPVSAAELYTSNLFVKSKQYALQHAQRWYILSAEHGLLDPQTILSSYDKSLNEIPIAERRLWAARVLDQLFPKMCEGDEVTILAGARYQEFLIEPLVAKGLKVSTPMANLPIGKRLQWLNQRTTDDPRRRDLGRL